MAAVKEMHPVMDGELLELPLQSLIAAGDNPRKDLGDLAELAISIKANGLLEPIVATPGEHGRYLIVAGHRRHAAAELAALETVPVYVRVMDDQQRVAAMLVENLQRSDLSPLEEAGAFRRLVDDYGMPQRKLAETIGRSQGHISKRLALLDLPAPAQKALDSGGITIAEAVELAKVKDPKRRNEAWKRRGQTYGGLEAAVREVLEEDALEAKNAKLREEAEAAGVRVLAVKFRSRYDRPDLPKGTFKIERDPYYGAVLKLDPKKHASEPCHAIVLNPFAGDSFAVCTDRSRHPKVKTADELDRSRRSSTDAKQKAKQREAADASKARTAAVVQLLAGGKVAKPDATKLVIDGLISASTQAQLRIACGFLAVEPIRTKDRYSTSVNYAGPLRELAAKNDRELMRVGLAIALGITEENASSEWHGWTARDVAYVRFLEQHGHKLHDIERKKIGDVQAKRSA